MYKVIKMMLCLNHGQADIERALSVKKILPKDNMKEAPLISEYFIYDDLTVKYIKPETLVMAKELLKSVKSTRIRYDEHLRDQKKEKKLSEKET